VLDFIRAKDDITKLTNFNLSVAVPDEFMVALREEPHRPHRILHPRTGEVSPLPDPERPGEVYTVGRLFDLIVDRAHHSGEPGVVFIDQVNRSNPLPHLGPIEATNPCGEQPLQPYESCNLGSVNLARFVRDGEFDEAAYGEMVRLGVRFLDNVVDVNRLPLPELEEANLGSRKIGLGVMGFADALFLLGIPYDSPEAVGFCHRVMGILEEESHAASEALAGERGTFPRWEGSVWDTEHHRPMRNATTTTVAPTGTISIIAGCSGGIEPVFSPAFFRNVLDGDRLVEVNPAFLAVARERGFATDYVLEQVATEGTVQGVPNVPGDVKRVFVSARDVKPEWHLRMQAAAQAHVDAAVSKTVNFPADATREEVRDIYLEAHRLGLKGITVYRDGSRAGQPMALKEDGAALVSVEAATPVKLPEILPCVRVRQKTPFGNLHAKISVDPRSERELEVFAQLGKAGDLASSDLEAICRLLSMFLRVGGSLDAVVEQLEGIGSSLSVPSKEGRILSLGDGLAKALGKYLRAKAAFGLTPLLLGEADLASLSLDNDAAPDGKAPGYRLKCPECEGELVFEEGCAKCHACGFSQC
ncbi:MAG: adenosylcobalamin-dependent ribonucleoside-diphosphate reductase, partial [Planctomycetota bacterium]